MSKMEFLDASEAERFKRCVQFCWTTCILYDSIFLPFLLYIPYIFVYFYFTHFLMSLKTNTAYPLHIVKLLLLLNTLIYILHRVGIPYLPAG